MVIFIIFNESTLFQNPDKGKDGSGGVDPLLYQQDCNHVLEGKEDGVIGTSNLLEMVLGVLEGLFNRGLF